MSALFLGEFQNKTTECTEGTDKKRGSPIVTKSVFVYLQFPINTNGDQKYGWEYGALG